MRNKIRDALLFVFPLRLLVAGASFARSIYDKMVLFDRILIANRYLRGSGIEIGALHAPLVTPPRARVKYVDRMSVDALREHYPELKKFDLVKVDIEDDGEMLRTISDSSQDFVIANHFLEHCENPLLALKNMYRVLKKDGIVYLAIPDKRYTFDKDRPLTDFDHLEKDYREGVESSRSDHYREWARFCCGLEDEKSMEEKAASLLVEGYSIHFHVWTQKEMLDLIQKIREVFNLDFDLEMFLKRGRECIFVLRKADSFA